jgi:hypothetical protein
MRRISLLIAFALLGLLPLQAQKISAGFRAGLNFATISGPLEMDDNGNELEEFSYKSGFHLGGMVNVKFNDVFSLRAELAYSQKGTEYNYLGTSYWIFDTANESNVYATGTRNTTLTVNNSYLDFPITAVARLGRVELSGGFNFGILATSRAAGELTFSGLSDGGTAIDPFTIALEFNYFRQSLQRIDVDEVEIRRVDGQDVIIPKVLGAYPQDLGEGERLYRTLDFGLVGGLSFYLNQGLFLGLRVNYGLADVTKSGRDASRYKLDTDKKFIFRNDDDRNLNLQASIGFNF